MEKNVYIAPECLVVELDTIQMIAASLEMNVGSKEGVESMGVNSRRGEWGNLWSDNQSGTRYSADTLLSLWSEKSLFFGWQWHVWSGLLYLCFVIFCTDSTCYSPPVVPLPTQK